MWVYPLWSVYMPVASQVDTILIFFKYFSFLCDLGCFGMVVLAGY